MAFKVDQLPLLFKDFFLYKSANDVDTMSAVLDVASPTPLLLGGCLACSSIYPPIKLCCAHLKQDVLLHLWKEYGQSINVSGKQRGKKGENAS